MKKTLKFILPFLIFIFLYFIPALLFKSNPAYYKSLTKPFYAPPAFLFGIMWPILYAILSFILTDKLVKKELGMELILYFIINYGISFFFNKVFFIDKNLFLSFVVTFLSFVSGIFITTSIGKQNKKEALLMLPYLIWTAFASILMANIYLIN